MLGTRVLRIGLPAIVLALLVVGLPAAAAPAEQSPNLLTNPGFEPPYNVVVTAEGGGSVANGWSPWWFNDPGPAFAAPEFAIAPKEYDPNRVHGGSAAQAIFRPSVLWQGGVYQKVNVPVGALLEFSAWGHAWSSFCQKPASGDPICDPSDSHYGIGANRIYMMVGIDPTGADSPFGNMVMWSPVRVVWDHFEQFTVHARAQSPTVTVFTWSSTEYPAVVNNVYWDDAALKVIDQASTPPPGGPSLQPKSTINVRSGPGLSFAVIGKIGPGAWYPITGQQNGWYSFLYQGQTGWVYGALVEVAGGAPPAPVLPQAVQSSSTINVRSLPDTKAAILGKLTPGSAVNVLGQQGQWYTIQYSGQIGYVYAPIVKAASAPPLPGNASISFAASTNAINAGQCPSLSWAVDGVQAIHFAGQGVTGHEGRSVCPTATTTYTLDVTLVDGSTTQRVVTIIVR